ncbi:MAG: hemerythrin family protein [Spirochaetia bacterium]|nr:hemerythrin family protein [Spirochaetia bacterium]
MDAASFQNTIQEALASWDHKLKTHNEQIDDDHVLLLQTSLELFRVIDEHAQPDVVNKTLSLLQSYVNDHFKAEEALMMEAGYPGIEAHRREHENLARACDLVIEEYHIGYRRLSSALRQFLQHFLVFHIPRMDEPMVAWLRKHHSPDSLKDMGLPRRPGQGYP